mmetsp:Transcript_12840/g.30018  ORF Transcript_12840/g.30018 Transcript_12840/m.30018 type:complete len:84 (+) Transcript_12840:318-569(+)
MSKRTEAIFPKTNNRCKHVYHHECMVQYLASNSHRRFTKRNERFSATDIKSPCPTCRRNFCTITEDHLAEALSNVSLNRNSTN